MGIYGPKDIDWTSTVVIPLPEMSSGGLQLVSTAVIFFATTWKSFAPDSFYKKIADKTLYNNYSLVD